MSTTHLSQLVLSLLITSTTVHAADADASKTAFAKLEAGWESQRTTIKTAHIKFRFVRTGARLALLSPTDFQRILSQLDLVKKPDDLGVLVRRISTSPPNGQAWADSEFFLDGDKRRDVHLMDSERGKRTLETIDNGRDQVVYNSMNQQMTVYRANLPLALTLNDLRFVPTIRDLKSGGYVIEKRDQERLTLRSGDTQLVVDGSSGFLYELDLAQTGQPIIKQIRQFAPVDYPGRATLPTASITANYRNGILANVAAVVIEQAEVNGNVPDSTFVVAAPEGTVIVDYTKDAKHPRVQRLSQPVANLTSQLAEQGSFTPAPQVLPTASSTTAWWLWGSCLVLCFAFVTWYVRRCL